MARRLHVVGAGLIGGSAALAAAAAGWEVSVEDADATAAAVIRRRLDAAAPAIDRPGLPGAVAAVDVVLVAVPPEHVATAVIEALNRYVGATVSDVASVKVQPRREVERAGADLTRYVPGHPIAGSEHSGAAGAQAHLFAGRSWVVCPEGVGPAAVAAVEALATAAGATPVHMSADAHDAALALTSHLPQVVASALADVLLRRFGERSGDVEDASLLAGPALLDMTRVAASQPAMWATIAAANTVHLHGALDELLAVLEPYARALDTSRGAAAATAELVERGRAGRRLVAGKRSRSAGPSTGTATGRPAAPRLGASDVPADAWAWVDVAVPDEAGALARLFATAAGLGINIEDVHVDHAPHRATGLVSLAVRSDDAPRLRRALRHGTPDGAVDETTNR